MKLAPGGGPSIRLVAPEQARQFAHLTVPGLRAPLYEPADKDLCVAVAFDATGEALGMAYGWGLPRQGAYELVSIYVTPLLRGRGLASGLLRQVEEAFSRRGYTLGMAFYTVSEGDPALARFLGARGWSGPRIRQYLCKGDLSRFCATPWFRVRTPKRFRIVDWHQLDSAARHGIRQRQQAQPDWYAPDQDPFVFERGAHRETSVAMLEGNRVVGWVLTHAVPLEGILRWTVSFVDPERARAGHIVHLWQAAARRQLERTTWPYLSWGVPLHHRRMYRFVRERMRPCLISEGYACTSWRRYPEPA